MPDHLVFFIHGVGQQYETYGNIQHHVSTIQKNTQEMLEALYHTTPTKEDDQQQASSSSSSTSNMIQVEFVVIEWHSILHALVDAKMDQATLENVPKVRLATNQWLMDCMYYFSKPYGQFIIDAICRQCNEAYHDYGDPKHVHMIGFSLGGVAAYDILSMQWDSSSSSSLDTTSSSNSSSKGSSTTATTTQQQQYYQHEPCMCATPNVCVPKLDFDVEHLFTCGSPIAAALVFRGFDYMHYRPPPHTRIHNIFHPYDPLGYRLETMIHPSLFANDGRLPPVRLARAPPRRSPLRLLTRIPNLGIKDFITQYYMKLTYDEDTSSSSSSDNDDDDDDDDDDDTPATSNNHKEVATIKDEGGDKDNTTTSRLLVEQDTLEEEQQQQQVEPEEFFPRRIDYMLNETYIDAYASEWIIAIKSHFRYWANRDLAFHIAKSLLE